MRVHVFRLEMVDKVKDAQGEDEKIQSELFNGCYGLRFQALEQLVSVD